jgi:hypothetical protein
MGLQSRKQAAIGSMLQAVQFIGLGLFLRIIIGLIFLAHFLRANLRFSVVTALSSEKKQSDDCRILCLSKAAAYSFLFRTGD